ncbi:MAG TPA: hypothetical protein VK400_07555 [Pyrinomonadaceae bacterium]|nr:hypothetical protein [Pyrinomonadaceae bacterium]
MKKVIFLSILSIFVITGLFFTSQTLLARQLESASGHGTLINPDGSRRQFSFSAHRNSSGTVNGQANLHVDGYQLKVDISCMKVVGNVAIFGGTTRRTNDPNLVDAVYFSVQDNGEPGKNRDKISRVFFFDDDPTTTGDPQLCQFNTPTDFPLETIESGNIQVRQ